jgi:RNA polymerase sigma-70 factor (ECF subfamily)
VRLLNYEGLTEEELMKLYQSGDVDALGQMAILLLPKLAVIARCRFSDRNLAEEALQEFWIKIINKASTFKHDSKVLTWAYQVVNNTYLDLIRRESTRSYLNEELSIVESKADNAREFAEASANEMTVKSALLKIPKDQAEAVALVWLDGFSIEESAKILGIPANTVKSRISRGKAALAEVLRELDPRAGNQEYAKDV